MIEINLLNQNKELLEIIKVKSFSFEFVLHRGRLFQRIPGTNNFIQCKYLELY